jgi:hypothetical protein
MTVPPDLLRADPRLPDLHQADPAELIRSARRLAAVATGLNEAARDLAAASGLLTERSMGGGASGARAEVGALAASLRRQRDELAEVAAELRAHAQAVELARGGSWAGGEGYLASPGGHPTPTWAVIGASRPGQAALAELDRSARRTTAALAALFPDRIPVDSDPQEVSRAMRRQVAARLDDYKVRPG